MKYLFDASAIYSLMREKGGEDKLIGNYTISIARYELGNTIWKESAIHKRLDAQGRATASKWAENMLALMHVENPGAIESVIAVSASLNMSFYDASYVYFAKLIDLPLVTGDAKLIKKARPFIKVLNTSDI